MTESWWSQIKRVFREIQSRELRRHRMEEMGREIALAGESFSKRKVENLLTEVDKKHWNYYIEGFSYGYEKGFKEYMNDFRKRTNQSKNISIKR